jgi:TatD DNase family protein
MRHYFTDTHCHLDFPVFDHDRELILERCLTNNINAIVVPGVTAEHWPRVLSLCTKENGNKEIASKLNANKPKLLSALGLHPCFIEQHQGDDLQHLRQLCEMNNLSAIGEIGLDYYLKTLDRDTQRYYFTRQLEIASEYHLPVLIHARKSHAEIIKLLKSFPEINGIIHAYSGSYEQAMEFLKLDFKLGFGGAFTYPGAKKLRSLTKKLPLGAWVLETDAPDMSPVLHHQQRNSPEYLSEIALAFFALTESELTNSELTSSVVTKEQVIAQLEMNTHFIFPLIPVDSSFCDDNIISSC